VIDADNVETPKKPDEAVDAPDALALAEEAEAEAAEAEAVAAAARARARAIRLRRAASAPATETETPEGDTESADAESADTTEPTDSTEAAESPAEGTVDAADGEPEKKRRAPLRWVARIRWKIVAAVVSLLCTGGLIAVSVLMFIAHKHALEEQRRTAEYSAAARQGVVTLMSLDFNKAEDNVKRIIDNTTGQFRDEFQAQADSFTQVAKQSKVITEVNVNSAAVKTMDDNKASVLVSATSHVTNTAGAKREPRSWRLLVDLAHDGDQIKMSKVEFVP
jgi:Mce-associated membrane protein